jgi:hypothetical protein
VLDQVSPDVQADGFGIFPILANALYALAGDEGRGFRSREIKRKNDPDDERQSNSSSKHYISSLGSRECTKSKRGIRIRPCILLNFLEKVNS